MRARERIRAWSAGDILGSAMGFHVGRFHRAAAGVTRALTTLRNGPGVSSSARPASGRATFAETISQALEADGWSMVRHRATTGASELPLGAFLTQLGAAERFLTPMFAEIRERILEEADGRPVLISVDDVDLLDDSSAVLVHQMVAAGEAKVMATLRAGRLAPNELMDLSQHGGARRYGHRAVGPRRGPERPTRSPAAHSMRPPTAACGRSAPGMRCSSMCSSPPLPSRAPSWTAPRTAPPATAPPRSPNCRALRLA